MSTTSSKNFTTLYSGAGSVVPQGAYGNANVVSLLAAGTDGANTVTTISATGNITTDGYFVGNFAGNITGNISVPGANTQVLYNNAGNVGTATGFTFDNAANVFATPGNITAVGNVQGNYFLGNGSQLTGLPATYGNANVTTLLAAFGSNTISSTGNITTTANVSGGYILGNGSQLTGLPANYGNSNVVSLLAAFGSNTISSTGNITTSANVSGGFILGNGSQLTGLPATYSNANVSSFMAAFGSNAISTTGNVTAGNFIGNGQYLTNINAGNITGSYGNANVAAFMAAFGSNTVVTTGNVSAGNVNGSNISVTGNVNISGSGINFAGGFVNASNHLVFAGNPGIFGSYNTGNTTGNAWVYVDGGAGNVEITSGQAISTQTWNFSGATGNLTLPGNTSAINYANGVNILTSATGTYGNANVAAFMAAFGSNTVSTTGNVTSGNFLTGNLVVAPGTGAGNIWLTNVQSPAVVTTTNNPARIIIGNSYTGNAAGWSVDYDPYSRLRQSILAVNQRVTRGDGNINFSGTTNIQQMELTANISTPGGVLSRSFGGVNFLHVGGGASAYQSTITSPAAFVGMNGLAMSGTNGNVALGNITLASMSGMIGAVAPQNGSNIGNAFGMLGAFQPGGATSTITNVIGFAPWTVAVTGVAPTTSPTNYNAFYNPGTASTYGSLTNINSYRAAANYYAFKNDDDVAQVQLGSLRRYHEFEAATATSGSFAIDKNTAQVHNIVPTGNCTITGYSNMVVTASDSVNNDAQVDTLTIIVEQGATPYTITMPTGAAYKYAANVRTVGTTANSVTMISVTAANVSGTTTYLTTISPEFV